MNEEIHQMTNGEAADVARRLAEIKRISEKLASEGVVAKLTTGAKSPNPQCAICFG